MTLRLTERVSGMVQRLIAEPFIRNLSMLLGGAAIAQLFGLLAMPLVARLYLPAHFGQLGLYMSALGFLTPVAMLRYEMAIPGAQDDRQASRVYLLAVVLAVTLGSLMALALLIPTVTAVLRQSGYSFGTWIIPLGVAMTAVFGATSFWAVRKGDFRELAKTKGTQGLSMVSVQILAGLLGWRPEGLLIGHLMGQSGGISNLVRKMWNRDREAFRGATFRELRQAAADFHRFPRFSAAAVLLESFTLFIPLVVLAYRFGPEVAGWVTMVQVTIWKPTGMLGVNMAQIIFHDFAEFKRRGEGEPLMVRFNRQARNFFLLGGALALALGLLGHGVIHFLFGPEWKPAVFCLWVYLPVAFFQIAVAPFGCFMEVFERQDIHLVRELVRAGIMMCVLAFVILGVTDWRVALVGVNGASILGYLFYHQASRRVIINYCHVRCLAVAKDAPPPLFIRREKAASMSSLFHPIESGR